MIPLYSSVTVEIHTANLIEKSKYKIQQKQCLEVLTHTDTHASLKLSLMDMLTTSWPMRWDLYDKCIKLLEQYSLITIYYKYDGCK